MAPFSPKLLLKGWRPIHMRSESPEGFGSLDPPPQPLRLLHPPVLAHVAKQGASLVELLPGFGKVALLVEYFGIAEMGVGSLWTSPRSVRHLNGILQV
jgi:hypothetical protein